MKVLLVSIRPRSRRARTTALVNEIYTNARLKVEKRISWPNPRITKAERENGLRYQVSYEVSHILDGGR